MSNKSANILSGPLVGPIILFALPIAAQGILQQLFNSADIAVVGRFVGKEALAAVGSTAPIINIIVSLFQGLSLGGNVLISNLLGRGESNKVSSAVHTVTATAIIAGLFLIALGETIAPMILSLICPPPEVFNLSLLYLRIYFLGMPVILLYNFGAAILRSKGDSQRPLIALATGGVINVILNLVLVIAFSLGVAGVAIATIVSNVISSLLVCYFLIKEDEPMRLKINKLALNPQDLIVIAKIGFPAGLQGMVFSFSNICIQGAINSLGAAAMAGTAAAMNYSMFNFLILTGFSQSCVTFVATNWGANNIERCKKSYRYCFILGVTICALFCLNTALFNRAFISIFTHDSEAIPFAAIRLTRADVWCFLCATYEITASSLRARGHSLLPSIIVFLGSCVFRIVYIILIFSSNPTYDTLMMCYPLSWVITSIAMISSYFIIGYNPSPSTFRHTQSPKR